MRENQVDSLLSKFIKRAAARNNISEKRMVVFNVRFFIGRIGITKEEMTFKAIPNKEKSWKILEGIKGLD